MATAIRVRQLQVGDVILSFDLVTNLVEEDGEEYWTVSSVDGNQIGIGDHSGFLPHQFDNLIFIKTRTADLY